MAVEAGDTAATSSGDPFVLVPLNVINCPPSVIDRSFTLEQEHEQRLYACSWIQKACILLRAPAETTANAQTILHRFYFRRSMKEFDLKIAAAAAVYLGCKLGEAPRRIRDLINVVTYLEWFSLKEAKLAEMMINDPSNVEATQKLILQLEQELHFPPEESKTYKQLKINIQRVERHILRETGFMISKSLVHPHRYILQYIHSLLGDTPKQFRASVSQKAWGYLNDSLRLPLCCCAPPAVITAAAIALATEDCGLGLSQESNWFEIFDVSWDEIVTVSTAIKKLYTTPIPSYIKLANPPVPPPVPEALTGKSSFFTDMTPGSAATTAAAVVATVSANAAAREAANNDAEQDGDSSDCIQDDTGHETGAENGGTAVVLSPKSSTSIEQQIDTQDSVRS